MGRRSRLIAHDGETLTIAEWAARLGISRQALHRRLAVASPEEALTRSRSKRGRPRRERPDVPPSPRLTHDGRSMTIAGWTARLGVTAAALYSRLCTMSLAEALGAPARTRARHVPRLITHDGVSLTVRGWAERLGIKYSTMAERLRRADERAFTPGNMPSAVAPESALVPVAGVTLREWADALGVHRNTVMKRHRRKAGLCIACQRPSPDRVYCAECADEASARSKRWRNRNADAGMCAHCTSPVERIGDRAYSLCARHRAEANKRQRRANEARAAATRARREARLAAGLCTACSEPAERAVAGRQKCAAHLRAPPRMPVV